MYDPPQERWCEPCDPNNLNDRSPGGLWSEECKYPTKPDCERDCQPVAPTRTRATMGCVSGVGQEAMSPTASSAGLASLDASSATLGTTATHVSHAYTRASADGVGKHSAGNHSRPARNHVTSIPFGFRPSGGVGAACACDGGFDWQKQGEHPCGCSAERKNRLGCYSSDEPDPSRPKTAMAAQYDALASSAPLSACGQKCGLDITDSLEALYRSIMLYISTPGRTQEICKGTLEMSLLPGPNNFADAWDICELAHRKDLFSQGDCGVGACEKTAMVNGECYSTDDINYWLWGVMIGLCNYGYHVPKLAGTWLRNNSWDIINHPIISAVNLIPPYRAAITQFGTNERTGIAGRTCWLLRGYSRVKPHPRNPDPNPHCKEAIEEHSECQQCWDYRGKLHARLKGIVGEHSRIHNISTSRLVKWEPTIVDSHGLHYPGKLCGDH